MSKERKEKIAPLITWTERKKPVHSFLPLKYSRRSEVWKCDCGGVGENIFCTNCGESKISQKHKRKKVKEAEQDKELGKWLV